MKLVLFLCLAVTLALFETTSAVCNDPNGMDPDGCVRRCDIPTCSNPNPDPSQICTADCFDGCVCKDGYIKKDDANSLCVKKSDC
ncbi:hypothetical protein CDAR_275921 [Caerostris darwini]|uniref:TIL domain-containing protein n=1 Tax=Caerostris darwini TaxID=1538125 RepID=A0AAV4RR88_9ARAC|nr:hypothetical protein CDAR_275921 [Caerostris darwini]